MVLSFPACKQEFTGWEREKEKLTYRPRDQCYSPDVDASIWVKLPAHIQLFNCSFMDRLFHSCGVADVFFSCDTPTDLFYMNQCLSQCKGLCFAVAFVCSGIWYLFSTLSKWMPRLNCLFQHSELLFLSTRQCYCVTGKKCCFDYFWKVRSL